jgi:carotenoid cleavage dioxygenase-like enzyme
MTPSQHTHPPLVDMANHAFLSGLFAPQRKEVDVTGLTVTGDLPADLVGSYLRNGPNPRFDPIGSYTFPIDGDAMVHQVDFDGSTVSYRNRFVRTPAVIAEEEVGRALWSGLFDPYFPNEDDLDGAENTGRDMPDIHVVKHGGRLLAMAEATRPYALDPSDLSTIGVESCDGAMLGGSTAHPKIDPATGEMLLFNYAFEAPYLTWSVVGPDGKCTRRPTAIDGVDMPMMIHDMALTQRYVVIFVCPLKFDIIASFTTGASPLEWLPELGTRIALVPRDGSPVKWVDSDPFWVWHFANAYDTENGEVAVDYVRWNQPTHLGVETAPLVADITRTLLNPTTGRITHTTLSDSMVEFPRIDDRSLTRPHNAIASSGQLPGGQADTDTLFFDDLTTGRQTYWDSGTVSVGEPIFMSGEAHGYWGTIGTDHETMTSAFYVFPTDDPASGPLCSVHLPIRVPAGLHGAWMSGSPR